MQAKKAEDRERKVQQARDDYLASLARQAAAASTSLSNQGSVIDLDGDAPNEKGDSDIEMMPSDGKRTASASVPPAAPAPAQTQSSMPQEGMLRLTLVVSKDQKYTVGIRQTKKVSALVNYYLKEAGLDKSKASGVKITFDGEELSHNTVLEDADVEDECQLEIRPPA